MIKPIPPKNYDGAADARMYHRFVMEGEAYLRDGKVQKERQIRILAHYLDGRAYDFYMQKVASDDPKNWNIHKFYTELFNFCFPVDYRQQMRLKLDDTFQEPSQTVSEYVFELQELFSMVGTMPAEMKIIKLWYGLSTRIQKALWRDGLHPDSSSWDNIVAKAEMIEIADNVIDRRDESSGHQSQRGWSLSNLDNGGHTRKNRDSESRFVNKEQGNGTTHHSDDNDDGGGSRHIVGQNRQDLAPTFNRCLQGSGASGPKETRNSNLKKESGEFADLNENAMNGNGSVTSPGVPSYAMDMTLVDWDDNDILESLPIGSITFAMTDFSNNSPSTSKQKWPRRGLDADGIRMDPEKVETSKEFARQLVGRGQQDRTEGEKGSSDDEDFDKVSADRD